MAAGVVERLADALVPGQFHVRSPPNNARVVATSTECVIASADGMPVAVSRAATLPIGRSGWPSAFFSSPPMAADWQAERMTSATWWRWRFSPSLAAETKSGERSGFSKRR